MATIKRTPEPDAIPHEWTESELTERPSRPAWMDAPVPEAAPAEDPKPKGGKGK